MINDHSKSDVIKSSQRYTPNSPNTVFWKTSNMEHMGMNVVSGIGRWATPAWIFGYLIGIRPADHVEGTEKRSRTRDRDISHIILTWYALAIFRNKTWSLIGKWERWWEIWGFQSSPVFEGGDSCPGRSFYLLPPRDSVQIKFLLYHILNLPFLRLRRVIILLLF